MKDESLKNLVHQILLDDRCARNSDKVLIDRVVRTLTPDVADMPFRVAIFTPAMPSWESITRIRRDWQASDPNCMSDKQVQKWRAMKEEEYRKEYGHG